MRETNETLVEGEGTALRGGGDPPASGGAPYREALECLTEARVRFCLLRDDPDALETVRDLDLLVHPADREVASAALGRAGFVPQRDRRRRGKLVFLRYASGRFFALDVHMLLVQGGVEYMSARGALGRVDRSGPVPRLCPEDQFLHLLLHNVLGKGTLQDKHAGWMRGLRAAGLDPGRLDDQARRFGLRFVVRQALDDLDALAGDAAAVGRLRRRALGALRRRPANLLGMWQSRHGDRPRLRRRPVVLALLGPDGSGKTSFADALEASLRDSPLGAGRVYMGCWGHDLLPMRQARRLVPPQVSYARLCLRRCGLAVGLTVEEQRVLAAEPASAPRLAWRALRSALKSAAFHAALGLEMSYRYLRHIAFSRRPIVLTDRYVYDLEFRQGKTPFAHGALGRRLLYRLFPTPDGILYLSTPYDLVERRKPQLDRQQFETMDQVFRQVLRRHHPLELASDASPEAMARAFLTRHWERILAHCNRRA